MPASTGPTVARASLRAAIVVAAVAEIFVSRFCQSAQRLARNSCRGAGYGMHASSVTPVLFAKTRPDVRPQPLQLPPPQNCRKPSDRSIAKSGFPSLIRTADSITEQLQNETHEPHGPDS